MIQRSPVLTRECIEPEEALQRTTRSGEDLPASIEDSVCMLQRCRKDGTHVLRLHVLFCKNGLETLTLLGNNLVSVLVWAGSLHAGQRVFDRLLAQNEVAWRTLVVGYVKCGKPQNALTLYQQRCTHKPTIYLNGPTSVALLKACTELKDIQLGNEVHAEVARTGLLEKDFFVGSTLMDMYAKFSMLAKTRQIFDKLASRNVVSWNTLLAAYANHGFAHETLKCVNQMRLTGVQPDAVTFVCTIKACGSIRAFDKGQEIHDEIERQGLLDKDHIIGSAIVDMYIRGGSLEKGKLLFDKLPVRDVVAWTAIIRGFAEQGDGVEALKCFKQMQLEGIALDAVALACILQLCGNMGALDKGQQLHAAIVSQELLHNNLLVGNTIITMYAKCGLLHLAQKVFDELSVRDVVSWNSLIAGHTEQGLGEKALEFFEEMQFERVVPNAVTFVHCVKACGSIEAIDRGLQIHAEIERRGMETDPVVGNTLVDMYAKCGLLVKAQEVFDKLPARTGVSWTSLIAGYVEQGHGEEALRCYESMVQEGVYPDSATLVCSLRACGSIGATRKGEEFHAMIEKKQGLEMDLAVNSTLVDMYLKVGQLTKAREVFDNLQVRNACLWTALIAGLAEQGQGEEALKCFDQMSSEGNFIDDIAYICTLKACGNAGATDKGKGIHAEIARKGVIERDPVVGSVLVDMYAKCGSAISAQEVFDKLLVQDVSSWNSLIAGYAQLGDSHSVSHAFARMLKACVKPDPVTFISILNARHASLSDEGLTYYDTMRKDYGILPTMEHRACLVDVLCRTGNLDKALLMIKRMPFCPDLAVWHTLLSACGKWGNVELGEVVFEHALHMDKKHAAASLFMSHISISAFSKTASDMDINISTERTKLQSIHHYSTSC